MKRFPLVTMLLTIALATSAALAVHYVPPQKYGKAFTLHFSLYDSNSPWQFYETAPAADDVYIRKDGGAAVRVTNAVTDLNHTMSLVLTATEMTAAVVTVDVNDESSPALFGSDTWVIYTHGNASAQNALDLDTASTAQTADVGVRVPQVLTFVSVGGVQMPKVTLSAIVGTALTESVGGYLSAAFKKFFDVAAPVLTTGSANQTGDTYNATPAWNGRR